jgi:acetate---CoA ligase (ADP-forming)
MLKDNIRRLLRPRTVAIVGANEKMPQSNNAFNFMRDSAIELFLVNPNRPTLYDRPVHSSLSAIGRPIDAILGLVNAERTIELVAEAAATGSGGVVAHADGFRECGAAGVAREQQLIAASEGRVAVLGPNCNGFIDLNRGVKLSGAPPVSILRGTVAVVAHSGALMSAVASAGFGREIGFGHLISTGNEAVVDLADCVEFLLDDPVVSAICIVLESVRRPAAFFAAAARAAELDKPIIALKLGRGARAQAIVSSHTGAIAGESWAYDAVFRQYGIAVAHDIAEVADRVAYFAQLPRTKWVPVKGVAVLTTSGGGASLISDIFSDHNIPMPELESVKDGLAQLLPNAKVSNPLDMTGSVVTKPDLGDKVLQLYSRATEADTLVMNWFCDDAIMTIGGPLLERFSKLGGSSPLTVGYGSFDDGGLGEWARSLPAQNIAVTRGLISTARALQTMRQFMLHRERLLSTPGVAATSVLPAPAADRIVASDVGPMLDFGSAMALLEAAGLRVAPFRVIGPSSPIDAAIADLVKDGMKSPFVVKLADVPHRTDIGAVRLGVTYADLTGAVVELRQLAIDRGVPGAVAIQPQLAAQGEAFLGVKNNSALGPMVVCGLGGIFVEVLKRAVGLMAPFTRQQAMTALDELADTGVFQGLRGARPWDPEVLADALDATGRLADGARSWLETLDINPLLYVNGEFVAVDALVVLRS